MKTTIMFNILKKYQILKFEDWSKKTLLKASKTNFQGGDYIEIKGFVKGSAHSNSYNPKQIQGKDLTKNN